MKVNEWLTRGLAAGQWRTGERLPAESVLASDLGCAVGTLRKALSQLESQGLIERRHGSGNYVKQAPSAKSVYEFFRLSLIAGGGLPTAAVMSFQTIEHPVDIPFFGQEKLHRSTQHDAHIRLPQCYRLRRLRFLNSLPIALEEIYFDTRHNPTLSVNDLGEALYLFYQTKLGFWIANAQDQVSISTVPDWTNPLFALPIATPCGYITRRSFDSQGHLEEFSRTWFNPQLVYYMSKIN